MKIPAVSVIIPIYNGEAYLRECLDSVMAQTLGDIQIICINDGSTDQSAAILKEYESKDDRIEAVHLVNGGQSRARNVGMSLAKGRYVHFLDCDDRILPNTYQILVEQADAQQLDILYFDGKTFFDSPELEKSTMSSYRDLYVCKTTITGVRLGIHMFETLFGSRSYRVSPCMQILRCAFLDEIDLKFYEGIVYEDNIFTFKSMTQAKRTAYCHRAFYERRIREGSTMTSRKDYFHLKSYITAYTEIAQYALAQKFSASVMKGVSANLRVLRSNAYKVYKSLTVSERCEAAKLDPVYETVILLCHTNASNTWKNRPIVQKMIFPLIMVRNGLRILHTQGVKAFVKRLLGARVCNKLRYLYNHTIKYHAYKPSRRAQSFAKQPFDPDQPFVSVILPVYNGSEYLSETIESLQAQTLKNVEFIFVDDGSVDHSVDIVEDAAMKDARIRVVRQKRMNAGAARNNGVHYAKGEYLMFLDSDDTFDKNLLLYSYDRAKVTRAQVVIFDADIIRHPDMVRIEPAWLQASRNLPKAVFAGRSCPDHLFQLLNPWTKLYLREYVLKEGFQYQSQFATNDAHFTMMALACAERIITLPVRLVHYHVGRQNNIQSRKAKDPLTVYNAFFATRKALQARGVLTEVECELTSKAMESVVREMETLSTEDSRKTLFDLLHHGGMEDLGWLYFVESKKAQARIGSEKVQHCRDIVSMNWEQYEKVHPLS